MSDMTEGIVSLDGFSPVPARFDRTVRWNGWLCPRLDSTAVETVLDAINAEDTEPQYLYNWTDGGELMLVDLQGDGGVELLEADSSGLFALGDHAWVWTEEPELIGIFNAVVTRDHTASTRDGEGYIAANAVTELRPDDESLGGALFEIQFADGTWMLARKADLTTSPLAD